MKRLPLRHGMWKCLITPGLTYQVRQHFSEYLPHEQFVLHDRVDFSSRVTLSIVEKYEMAWKCAQWVALIELRVFSAPSNLNDITQMT